MTLNFLNALAMGLTGGSLSVIVYNGWLKLANVILAQTDNHITENNTWIPIGLAVAITMAICWATYHITNYMRDQKEAIRELRESIDHIKKFCPKCRAEEEEK